MSEIKPVYQVRVRFNLWEDQTKEQYEDSKFGDGVTRTLYPIAAYEALQAKIKELEYLLKIRGGDIEQIQSEHHDELRSLKAENEAQQKLIEALETLCTHDYESKDDFIWRVKEKLKNGGNR